MRISRCYESRIISEWGGRTALFFHLSHCNQFLGFFFTIDIVNRILTLELVIIYIILVSYLLLRTLRVTRIQKTICLMILGQTTDGLFDVKQHTTSASLEGSMMQYLNKLYILLKEICVFMQCCNLLTTKFYCYQSLHNTDIPISVKPNNLTSN